MERQQNSSLGMNVTTLTPRPGKGLVRTAGIQSIISRSLNYIRAGYPIHLRGISGIGKTTIAFCVAEALERPVVLIQGDDEMTTSDLVGGESGYHSKKVHDNFIHSVLKVEEKVDRQWVDNKLTAAVEKGYTLIYDEYTRSKAEANNIFLPILQEGILNIPSLRGGKSSCLKVHDNFSAIFTSNPEEYIGVHNTTDALVDRLITIDLDHFDESTEQSIVVAKTGIEKLEAKKIVKIVKALRDSEHCKSIPSIRASIMIAKSVNSWEPKVAVSWYDDNFRQICYDVLLSKLTSNEVNGNNVCSKEIIDELIKQSFSTFSKDPTDRQNKLSNSKGKHISLVDQKRAVSELK